jgi:hypothetical protein
LASNDSKSQILIKNNGAIRFGSEVSNHPRQSKDDFFTQLPRGKSNTNTINLKTGNFTKEAKNAQ